MSGASDPIAGSLMGLFRDEVRTHAAALAQGLVDLEQDPRNSGKVEPLMRAAHSIKGAARIVHVEPAVRLAHVMEDLLVAAQHGRIVLDSRHIDLLLAGADRLQEIAQATASNYHEWLAAHEAALQQLVDQLGADANGQAQSSAQSSAESSATTSAQPTSVASPIVRPGAGAGAGVGEPTTTGTGRGDASVVAGDRVTTARVHSDEAKASTDTPLTAASADAHDARPTAVVQVPQPKFLAVDPALLGLFRDEVVAGCDALDRGLIALGKKLDDVDLLEPLMRAAHSIKGAARIVQHDAVVRIAQSLEHCFVSAQQRKLSLGGTDIPLLQQGAELLRQLGTAADANAFPAASTMEAAIGRLSRIGSGQSPAPAMAPTRPPITVAPPVSAASVSANSTPSPVLSHGTPSPVLSNSTPSPVLSHGSPTMTGPAGRGRTSEGEGESEAKQRVVRVTAESLTRLMSLAGESLVEARWLGPFGASLLKIKKLHDHLAATLDTAVHAASGTPLDALITDARRQLMECRQQLAARLDEVETHARQTGDLNSRLYHEVIDSRMRPFADGVQGFPRLMRDLSRQLGKKVQFEMTGTATPVDRDILEQLEAPLNHLLRNALDHGVETPEQRVAAGKAEAAKITLHARHRAGMLWITVTDDGRGISEERLRRKIVERKLSTAELVDRMSQRELYDFLFLPGFSTAEAVTEVSGRGVGLDVVHSMVQAVGGNIRVTSEPGRGTTFHLQLPITLSVIRAVLADIGGEPYAFPQNRLERLLRIPRSQLQSLEGRQYLTIDGRNIGTVSARQILELDAAGRNEGEVTGEELSVILLGDESRPFGLVVDRFRGEQDLVVRPLDSRLGRVPHISAAALMDDGAAVLIVDVEDLLRGIDQLLTEGRLRRLARPVAVRQQRKRILIVDDSITVREVQRQLLQSRGYDVTLAVDGVDGWHAVQEQDFDLVISDIDMPRMNGFDFVRSIKNHERLKRLPVVIVSYKDRPEDRLQGLNAGANYFLTKSSFHDETLVETVVELIGA